MKHSSSSRLAATLLAAFAAVSAHAQVTGPSSSASPYVLPVASGWNSISILTVGDTGSSTTSYQMAGIPDGLGAYDNGNGTFTVLMNHEIANNKGVARGPLSKGGFVSEWVINKSDLSVVSGANLIQNVYGWNKAAQASNTTATTGLAFNRLCSADLAPTTGLYNSASGKGTQARIFMNGEESGTTSGWGIANVATGADKGNTYILGKFNLATNSATSTSTDVGGWENLLVNPLAQDKTVVIGNNDGGTGIMTNSVAVYVGDKQTTGSEIEKAGLTNGTLKFVNVTGMATEGSTSRGATVAPASVANGTRFSLSDTTSTTFLRPEDGAWNVKNYNEFYFVTTDRVDLAADGLGTQVGNSRLWRLTFDDITNPDAGGKVDILIDGRTVDGQKVQMFDNLTVADDGMIYLQEDVGGNDHNGKVWAYNPTSDSLVQIFKHDSDKFGDVGVTPTSPFTNDEETSGVIDITSILGRNDGKTYLLSVDQAHYTTGISTANVEGGQLLLLASPVPEPSSYAAIAAVAALAGAVVTRRRRNA